MKIGYYFQKIFFTIMNETVEYAVRTLKLLLNGELLRQPYQEREIIFFPIAPLLLVSSNAVVKLFHG